jgi:hypothetical protein
MHVVERMLPLALRDAVRMRVYASSRRIGRPLQALHNAWDLWLGDIQADKASGGTSLIARVPTLGDAAPKLFEQGVLFDDGLKETDTVFDLLGDVISDVSAGRRNSPLYDAAMLRTVAGYERARAKGLGAMMFAVPNRPQKLSTVDQKVIGLAKKLQAETPAPERVRIMGRLDALFYEHQSFVLQLIEGQRVRGAWMKDSPEPLRTLWGQEVLIEGVLQFKPNGEPLALEAEVITQASEHDRFWSNIPKPKPRATKQPRKPRIRPANNPWDLVVGIWQGTQSDDEFVALVEELS